MHMCEHKQIEMDQQKDKVTNSSFINVFYIVAMFLGEVDTLYKIGLHGACTLNYKG